MQRTYPLFTLAESDILQYLLHQRNKVIQLSSLYMDPHPSPFSLFPSLEITHIFKLTCFILIHSSVFYYVYVSINNIGVVLCIKGDISSKIMYVSFCNLLFLLNINLKSIHIDMYQLGSHVLIVIWNSIIWINHSWFFIPSSWTGFLRKQSPRPKLSWRPRLLSEFGPREARVKGKVREPGKEGVATGGCWLWLAVQGYRSLDLAGLSAP